MTTFLAQNQFMNSAVIQPPTADTAGASKILPVAGASAELVPDSAGVASPAGCSAAAASSPVNAAADSSLSGDGTDENLQHMLSNASVGGVSAPFGVAGWTAKQMQDLHKICSTGDMAFGSENQGSSETTSADAPSKGCAPGKNKEAGSLPGLLDQNTDPSFGRAPSRLLESAGSDLALPVVPRRGTPDLETGGLAVLSPVTMAASPGITTVTHNPVTHAVEVRPQVSPGVPSSSLPTGESDSAVMLDSMPGESTDPQDLIDEIFVGARRLPQRELPADFHARLLQAIESDDAWADEPPLFLRSPTE